MPRGRSLHVLGYRNRRHETAVGRRRRRTCRVGGLGAAGHRRQTRRGGHPGADRPRGRWIAAAFSCGPDRDWVWRSGRYGGGAGDRQPSGRRLAGFRAGRVVPADVGRAGRAGQRLRFGRLGRGPLRSRRWKTNPVLRDGRDGDRRRLCQARRTARRGASGVGRNRSSAAGTARGPARRDGGIPGQRLGHRRSGQEAVERRGRSAFPRGITRHSPAPRRGRRAVDRRAVGRGMPQRSAGASRRRFGERDGETGWARRRRTGISWPSRSWTGRARCWDGPSLR